MDHLDFALFTLAELSWLGLAAMLYMGIGA